MKYKMLYKIIQSTDPQEVVDHVNDSIRDGWRPYGGLSIAAWSFGEGQGGSTKYAQAMTFRKIS